MKKWVYSKPVIQIVLCMAMIATAIRRDAIFPIKNTTIKLITDVMFGALTIFSIIRLVLAFDSLYDVYEYRKNTGDVKQKKQSCLYKLEDMIKKLYEFEKMINFDSYLNYWWLSIINKLLLKRQFFIVKISLMMMSKVKNLMDKIKN